MPTLPSGQIFLNPPLCTGGRRGKGIAMALGKRSIGATSDFAVRDARGFSKAG